VKFASSSKQCSTDRRSSSCRRSASRRTDEAGDSHVRCGRRRCSSGGFGATRRHAEPGKLIRDYYDAWSRGDADALRALLAEDYCGHVHTLAGTDERDSDELTALLESHASAFEHVEYEVRDVLREDGRVAARVAMHADHRETGRSGEIEGLIILRLEGGRIRATATHTSWPRRGATHSPPFSPIWRRKATSCARRDRGRRTPSLACRERRARGPPRFARRHRRRRRRRRHAVGRGRRPDRSPPARAAGVGRNRRQSS
jgi:ketosteroid isomerase-like protein